MINNPGILVDGWTNLTGGVDSSKSPELIDPRFVSFAVNVTFNGGKPRTRPQFARLQFTDAPESLTEAESSLLGTLFQGRGDYFDPVTGRTSIILAVNGLLIKLDPETGLAYDLNPTDRNNAASRVYFCQAEKFLIIQNGVDVPFIYDGTVLRRSKTGSNNPSRSVTTLVQASGVATCTTSVSHGFATGDLIEVFGVENDPDYTGTFYVTVTGANTFTYDVPSSTDSPATGTISCRFCPEVPVGSLMAYGQGRLFVASADRTEFIALDLIYGDERQQMGNILRHTEDTYKAEGGAFRLSASQGRIQALTFVDYQDTATGQGELIAFGERGASTFIVALPRASWKTEPIQRVLFKDIGCASADSIVHFNGDVMFKWFDGYRSYRMARAESVSYGQTPFTAELNRIQKREEWSLLNRISGATFDNRLLFTCLPASEDYKIRVTAISRSGTTVTVVTSTTHYFIPGNEVEITDSSYFNGAVTVASVLSNTSFTFETTSIAPSELAIEAYVAPVGASQKRILHSGFGVLDFTSVSVNAGKSAAAFDGVWTVGADVQNISNCVSSGVPKCYFVGFNGGVANSVWELRRTYGDDLYDAVGVSLPITSWIETKAYDFERPTTEKRLMWLKLWVSEIQSAEIPFTVSWRPDQYSIWSYWHSFTVSNFDIENPDSGNALALCNDSFIPGYAAPILLPTPPDVFAPGTYRALRTGYTFQIRIEWTGNCRLEKMLIFAEDLVEKTQGV